MTRQFQFNPNKALDMNVMAVRMPELFAKEPTPAFPSLSLRRLKTVLEKSFPCCKAGLTFALPTALRPVARYNQVYPRGY